MKKIKERRCMPEEQKNNQLQEIMEKLENGVSDFFKSKNIWIT